jgi:3-hydroxyisobutyrate/3-hydroxypropionate dehydrogenase
MAKNLRAKIPESDTLTIFDVNTASVEAFSKEAIPAAGVVVAKSPREVAEKSVSHIHGPPRVP